MIGPVLSTAAVFKPAAAAFSTRPLCANGSSVLFPDPLAALQTMTSNAPETPAWDCVGAPGTGRGDGRRESRLQAPPG